ncbi:MAG: HEPN domain-containing protein [Bacillota bacterium]
MESIDRLELARYRLEMAEKKLESAKMLLDQSHFADATSRAYYALLHGARALLATKGLDSILRSTRV